MVVRIIYLCKNGDLCRKKLLQCGHTPLIYFSPFQSGFAYHSGVTNELRHPLQRMW